MSMIDLASWLGSPRALGRFHGCDINCWEQTSVKLAKGLPDCCNPEPVNNSYFQAILLNDLPKPFAGLIGGFWEFLPHPPNMRRESPGFQSGTLPQSN